MSDRRIDAAVRFRQEQPSALLPLLFGSRVGGGEDGARLYLLLDAARDARIYPWLAGFGGSLQCRSLYQGDIGDSLAHVSPYLLALQKGDPAACWFAEAGFGRSWGVFVAAALALDDLRRHLRKFNLVYREDGTSMVFRFYDPRVLRRFLPLCTADELRRFFGPIDGFLVETEAGDGLIRFTMAGGELRQALLPVQAPAVGAPPAVPA